MTARAHLESLLKTRKLDVTVLQATSAVPWPGTTTGPPADDRAPTGVGSIDTSLGGGLRRGHLSEVIGARSSGRTTVVCRALEAAVSRGELTALVDTHDRFDPASAAGAGVDLARLLWIRETGDVGRALKAMNLVLQAGGFGLVMLDLADVSSPAIRGLPFTTWFRLARVIEGSPTVALVIASEHVARSSGGATIALDGSHRALWAGQSDRARFLRGLDLQPRVVGAVSR